MTRSRIALYFPVLLALMLVWHLFVFIPAQDAAERAESDLARLKKIYDRRMEHGIPGEASFRAMEEQNRKGGEALRSRLSEAQFKAESDFLLPKGTADPAAYYRELGARRAERHAAESKKKGLKLPEDWGRLGEDFPAGSAVSGMPEIMAMRCLVMDLGIGAGLEEVESIECAAVPKNAEGYTVRSATILGMASLESVLRFIHRTQKRDSFLLLEKMQMRADADNDQRVVFEIRLGAVVLKER